MEWKKKGGRESKKKRISLVCYNKKRFARAENGFGQVKNMEKDGPGRAEGDCGLRIGYSDLTGARVPCMGFIAAAIYRPSVPVVIGPWREEKMNQDSDTGEGARTKLVQERIVYGGKRIRYMLYSEPGISRAVYGTECESFYSLRLESPDDACDAWAVLPDIARDRTTAERIFHAYVEGSVTPDTAYEVIDSLLG